jgi:hypothetical protein
MRVFGRRRRRRRCRRRRRLQPKSDVQELGEDVLGAMKRQREAIERSRGAAADVRAATAEAESLVDRMSRWWRFF